MEIYVNQETIDNNLEQVVEKIIKIAQEKANIGSTNFIIPKEELKGLHYFKVCDKVKEFTNNTVSTGRGSLLPTGIKFYIAIKKEVESNVIDDQNKLNTIKAFITDRISHLMMTGRNESQNIQELKEIIRFIEEDLK